MIAAGVNDADNFNGNSSAERLAEDIFDNDFVSYVDKSQADVEADLKSFSSLALVQG